MPSVLQRTPADTNLLQPTKFLMSFSRIPTVQYFCQRVNLPGMEMNKAPFNTPLKDLSVPGNKLDYNPLRISFLIDEDMVAWQEMYAWMRSMGSPKSIDERTRLAGLQASQNRNPDTRGYSDATLVFLNNLGNSTVRVQFKDVFPISLSDVDFDTTSMEENMTGSASFYFDYYEFETT